MSSFKDFNNYQKSTLLKYRAGTSEDPYINLTETKEVIDGKIFMNEIPVVEDKVIIDSMYEVESDDLDPLTNTQYRVDYNEGIIYFNLSLNGTQKTYTYKGRGNHFVSASRVWTKEKDGEVLETLQTIIEAGKESIEGAKDLGELITRTETAIAETETATTNANTKASLADQKATLAQQQADYAKTQGDAAQSVVNQVQTAVDKANDAADYATEISGVIQGMVDDVETNSNYAKAQGDYAKTQGDYAKSKGDQAYDYGTSFVNKGAYNNTTAYKTLNIVTYNNALYQAIANTQGNLPTNTTYWTKILETSASATWDTISGKPDVEGHIVDKNNPHAVTAAQISAYTKAEVDTIVANVTAGKFTSIALSANANLNNITEEGDYHCPSNDMAATIVNAPLPLAFAVRVESWKNTTAIGRIQTFTTYSTTANRQFIRSLSSGVWGSWIEITGKLALTGGDMTGRIGRGYDTFVKHFQNVGGGFLNAAFSGYLKISIPMPITTPVNATAMNVTIDLNRLLGSSTGAQLKIKGRPAYANNTLTWRDAAAHLDRETNFTKLTLGQDGTNLCIILGEATTSWSYVGVSIPDLFVIGSYLDQWASAPWTISGITSLTDISSTLDVPIKITGTTDPASTTVAGISMLDDTLTSTSKTKSATADALRRVNENATKMASTSQVGQTQLEDSTSSTDKTKAGTADSVRRAKEEAITTSVNKIAKYKNSDGSEIDPNVTTDALIITAHANGPEGANTYYFIETNFYSSTGDNRTQVAKGYGNNKIRMRNYMNGVWSAWTDDLFTSVSNGKATLETTITAKKGTVSKAGSIPTFTELNNGINSIPTGTNTSDATVTAADVLNGKVAYGSSGKVTGNIPIIQANWFSSAGTTAIPIPKGYHDGTGRVGGNNLTGADVREGKNAGFDYTTQRWVGGTLPVLQVYAGTITTLLSYTSSNSIADPAGYYHSFGRAIVEGTVTISFELTIGQGNGSEYMRTAVNGVAYGPIRYATYSRVSYSENITFKIGDSVGVIYYGPTTSNLTLFNMKITAQNRVSGSFSFFKQGSD